MRGLADARSRADFGEASVARQARDRDPRLLPLSISASASELQRNGGHAAAGHRHVVI